MTHASVVFLTLPGHSDGVVSFLSPNVILLPEYEPDSEDYWDRYDTIRECYNSTAYPDLDIIKMKSYGEEMVGRECKQQFPETALSCLSE